MRFSIFFLISLLLHSVLFLSVRFRNKPDQAPEVFVRKGKTVIRMTIVPPKQDAIQPEKEQVQEKTLELLVPESEVKTVKTEDRKPDKQETVPVETGSSEDGAVSEAAMIGRSLPPYPLISRRRGEQGTVYINVRVNSSGKCSKAEITKSSGYRRLDQSALKWAREAVYTPGKKDGKSVEANLTLKVPFELE